MGNSRFNKTDEQAFDIVKAQNLQLRLALAYAILTLKEVEETVESECSIIRGGGFHLRIKEASCLSLDGETP